MLFGLFFLGVFELCILIESDRIYVDDFDDLDDFVCSFKRLKNMEIPFSPALSIAHPSSLEMHWNKSRREYGLINIVLLFPQVSGIINRYPMLYYIAHVAHWCWLHHGMPATPAISDGLLGFCLGRLLSLPPCGSTSPQALETNEFNKPCAHNMTRDDGGWCIVQSCLNMCHKRLILFLSPSLKVKLAPRSHPKLSHSRRAPICWTRL